MQKQTTPIVYGNWSFEYNPKQNIYSSNVDSYERGIFEHAIDKYSNSNLTNSDLEDLPRKSHNLTNEDLEDFSRKSHNLTNADLEDFRRASLIHKIARKKALSMLYTGGKLADLVTSVEELILKMCKQDLGTYFLKGSDITNNAGLAFPIGVNINNVVAHDSLLKSLDNREFFAGDLVKIDIGVHINGRIIDSAFSHIVTDEPGHHDSSNIYNSVLEASRDSMFNAIKLAGPDQRLYEMSETISEIIKSYEVDMGGSSLPINPVAGIGGHDIKQYQIHGGKLILSNPDIDIQGDSIMEEDEIYAIETYATTGSGVMTQNTELDACTHFMENSQTDIETNKAITKKEKKHFKATDLHSWLKTRQGLPFSSTWIDTRKVTKINKSMNLGISSGQLLAYPPLCDEKNSVVAQFEHTIHVGSDFVEIFSLGNDY